MLIAIVSPLASHELDRAGESKEFLLFKKFILLLLISLVLVVSLYGHWSERHSLDLLARGYVEHFLTNRLMAGAMPRSV